MRRFRASIYLSITVPEGQDLKEDREEATRRLQQLIEHCEQRPQDIAEDCSNLEIGAVAYYDPRNLSNPLDREI